MSDFDASSIALGIALGVIACLLFSLTFGEWEREPEPCHHDRGHSYNTQTNVRRCLSCGALL